MSKRPSLPCPAGAQMHPELRLITWHPRGVLDAPLAREILTFLETREAAADAPFHRYSDLSGLEAIHLSAADIQEFAQRRLAIYEGAAVKSAFLAFDPLAFGVAHMYERMMRRSAIDVRVFCRITSAAAWLEMPIEVLASA